MRCRDMMTKLETKERKRHGRDLYKHAFLDPWG
jgi:hypothetical protein